MGEILEKWREGAVKRKTKRDEKKGIKEGGKRLCDIVFGSKFGDDKRK